MCCCLDVFSPTEELQDVVTQKACDVTQGGGRLTSCEGKGGSFPSPNLSLSVPACEGGKEAASPNLSVPVRGQGGAFLLQSPPSLSQPPAIKRTSTILYAVQWGKGHKIMCPCHFVQAFIIEVHYRGALHMHGIVLS